MAVNGTVTRRIGRPVKDSSPMSFEEKFCAAKMPDIKRIAVPELPISRSDSGATKPRIPTPSMVKLPFSGPCALTPIARNALNVAKTSSPSRRPVIWLVPFANDENMTERCDIDLSPGTRILPAKPLSALAVVSTNFELIFKP